MLKVLIKQTLTNEVRDEYIFLNYRIAINSVFITLKLSKYAYDERYFIKNIRFLSFIKNNNNYV